MIKKIKEKLFKNYVHEHDLPYTKYNEDKLVVTRTLKLDKDVAETINKTIAVFNNEFGSLRRINSSDVVNIGLECFFKQLCILNEEEAIFYLKNKALKEIEKELANSNIDLSKYDGLADLEDGKL